MCRNIRPLYNFEPPATHEEVHDAALQFVRKVSGFTKPAKANEEAFDRAVEEISEATMRLLGSLVTAAPRQGPRGRGGQASRPLGRALRRVARRPRAARRVSGGAARGSFACHARAQASPGLGASRRPPRR